jgi:hypothetical protein
MDPLGMLPFLLREKYAWHRDDFFLLPACMQFAYAWRS